MSPLSRRTFLRHSAVAATAGLTAASLRPSVWAAPVGANGAIRLGLIGCGAKGTAHVQQILKRSDARVVALCDVDPAQLAKVTAVALTQMAAGMLKAKAGTLLLNSGYRSFDTQKIVHERQVARLGLKAGEALAARPGYSEHQTGLAADVSAAGQGCVIQVCFATTKAGKWLAANAWQYGFILRYPNGQTATTGYQFEPWHFRYVGVDLATEMKSQNITVLEKFWKLPAAPSYTY